MAGTTMTGAVVCRFHRSIFSATGIILQDGAQGCFGILSGAGAMHRAGAPPPNRRTFRLQRYQAAKDPGPELAGFMTIP
jgi:hypothetical protein